jgi:hypothetical protein
MCCQFKGLSDDGLLKGAATGCAGGALAGAAGTAGWLYGCGYGAIGGGLVGELVFGGRGRCWSTGECNMFCCNCDSGCVPGMERDGFWGRRRR